MFYSPLRYPGGKAKLSPLIKLLIEKQGLVGGTYIEPFAGGAGVALDLLFNNVVGKIVINDYDKGIYSFWRAILTETEKFIERLRTVPLNMEEWDYQRDICLSQNKKYSFELGFATFYMNRTNRSGIIKAGVIGGKKQEGRWKLDARFNREDLIKRIQRIETQKKNIHLYNKEIESFVKNYVPKYDDNAFIYFDPPYFEKGKDLYLNFFSYDDHVRIEKIIKEKINCDFIITYDAVDEIKEIYKEYNIISFDLNYSIGKKRKGNEIIILENKTKFTKRDFDTSKSILIHC